MPSSRRTPSRSRRLLSGAIAGAACLLIALPLTARKTPTEASSAKAIDSELRATWSAAGIEPAAAATDAEFVRRASLDIIGRVPTAGEALAYIGDSSTDKKVKLIDALLATGEYSEHFTDVYMDLLIGRDNRLRPRIANAPRQYLTAAFAEDRRFDRMARELIASTGSGGEVYYLVAQARGGGNLEHIAGTTARVFLGLQIQCAQCHDHPYITRFKKNDFRDFAAYFGETRIRRGMGRAFEVRNQSLPPWVQNRPKFQKRLEKNPGLAYAFLEPRFFDRTIKSTGQSRRDVLADAILTSDLFPKVTVNRTWRHMFGAGIVEPWDDLGFENNPAHPKVLRDLAVGFATAGYSHKWLIKTIALSDAYGRAAYGGKTSATAQSIETLERSFARAAVRPLSADQLFRSQLVATGIEDAGKPQLRRLVKNRRKQRALREYLFAFDDDEGATVDSFSGNVPQALLLRNGELTNLGATAERNMVLGRILAASKDPGQRVEWMFLAAYSRLPTAAERARYVEHVNSGAVRAYEDLYNALLSSTEFITNH